MNILKVSIKKAELEAERINKLVKAMNTKYGTYIRLESGKPQDVRDSILSDFKVAFSQKANNISLSKINLSEQDEAKLKTLDSYSEFKNIYMKYIGEGSDNVKLKQLEISLPFEVFDSEAKKYEKISGDKYFNSRDYRRQAPLEEIKTVLNKKTAKYVTLWFGESIGNYRKFDELSEVFRITCGFRITYDDMNKKWNESAVAYTNRLNSLHPTVTFKAFQNGNVRITIDDKQLHNNFRRYFIDKEMRDIIKMRKQYPNK